MQYSSITISDIIVEDETGRIPFVVQNLRRGTGTKKYCLYIEGILSTEKPIVGQRFVIITGQKHSTLHKMGAHTEGFVQMTFETIIADESFWH
ncbi:MAG: hypothetical protein DME19_13880 [Verrucomicrobia bacterium]|nr:MAG: hypothetical protein DME19_13880 [Verrucomicrobiota bacterium]